VIALLEARSAGLLSRAHWLRNIIAGVVVGVVALPLAMAFAIASGAKSDQGLCTAIVAGLAVAVVANIVAPFFAGFAASGAIAKEEFEVPEGRTGRPAGSREFLRRSAACAARAERE
jgi:MFS superfamily sulfate permease-like transporter